MKQAIIFPGQGSQSFGMGCEIAAAFPEAKAVFEEVDDTLSQKLSSLMFEGPLEDLTLTENAQPALMAVSLALVRVLEKGNIPIYTSSYAAGHSLGEYSALCATNAFTLSDTARLLRARGLAMKTAVPNGKGGMMAILGGDLEAIEKLCEKVSQFGICTIANDNCPGQIVISGEIIALEQVPALAEKYGVRKCIPLNVSGPFHSILMDPATCVMKKHLEETPMKDPMVPILPNVTAVPETRPEFLKNLLVKQITGQVRWRETLLKLKDLDVKRIVEVGSGTVLSGLVKRTCPEMEVFSIHTPQELDAFVNKVFA
jgi:[acyl-carrier-protein] S-malonyltransferase